jgi:hypothetical protein
MKWTKLSRHVISPFSNLVLVSLFQQELFLERFKPSMMAHHNYLLEGTSSGSLHREICTAGTCARILDDITMRAKDNSPGNPNLYWLSHANYWLTLCIGLGISLPRIIVLRPRSKIHILVKPWSWKEPDSSQRRDPSVPPHPDSSVSPHPCHHSTT